MTTSMLVSTAAVGNSVDDMIDLGCVSWGM
jgi:hypothetical protein